MFGLVGEDVPKDIVRAGRVAEILDPLDLKVLAEIWNDDLPHKQLVEIAATEEIVTLMVDNADFTMLNAHKRQVKGPASQVIDHPLAVRKFSSSALVGIGQARRNRFLQQEHLF